MGSFNYEIRNCTMTQGELRFWQTLDELKIIAPAPPLSQIRCTLNFEDYSCIFPFPFVYKLKELNDGNVVLILLKKEPCMWQSYLVERNNEFQKIDLMVAIQDEWQNKSISAEVEIKRTADQLCFTFSDQQIK